MFDLNNTFKQSKVRINDKSIVDHGKLDLTKNPLQYNFMNRNTNSLDHKLTHTRDSMVHENKLISQTGHLLRNILNKKVEVNRQGMDETLLNNSRILQGLEESRIAPPGSNPHNYRNAMDSSVVSGNPLHRSIVVNSSRSYPNGNPLASNFKINEKDLNLPDKGMIQNMILESKMEYLDEVNLKEKPFYVQNYTGYPLIFHLKFNEYSSNFYVPNQKTVGLPYPYHVNQEILKGKADHLGEFNYWIFLMGHNQEFLKCIYRGSEVIGKFDDELIQVPKGFTQGKDNGAIKNLAKILKGKKEEEKAMEESKLYRSQLDTYKDKNSNDEFHQIDAYAGYKDEQGNWKNWSKGDLLSQDFNSGYQSFRKGKTFNKVDSDGNQVVNPLNHNPLKRELKLKSSKDPALETDELLNAPVIKNGRNFDVIKMTSNPNIMRQLIKLNSKVVIKNEVNPNVKIMFKKSISKSKFIELKEHQMAPLPFDMVDEKIKLTITTKKGKSLDGKWFCAKDIINKHASEVVNYSLGDAFALNMFVEDLDKKTTSKAVSKDSSTSVDVKNIVMVPPLIIKNKILTNLNFYIVKRTFERYYGEKHKIGFSEDDYEIYEILEQNMKIRLGINGLKSDIIDIDFSDKDEVTKKSVWINKEGRKAINVNILGRFERGSYIIDVYMKAMLVDELFMELKYS